MTSALFGYDYDKHCINIIQKCDWDNHLFKEHLYETMRFTLAAYGQSNGDMVENGHSTKFKLTYFNFRARAELCRLLFALAGQEFEDERIKPEQWLAMKGDQPFGQLPVLSVNDVKISQSHAIARFVAREFGFDGKTNLERAKADMIVDCCHDMLQPIDPYYRTKCEARKAEMKADYEEQLPIFMAMMEKLLTENDGGNGYFVGTELTWADLAVMNSWSWIAGFGVFPILSNYPKLKEHRERMEALPAIARWLEQRPETPV